MDIDEVNDIIMKAIINSLSDGPDAALEFATMNYTNSNNDYVKKSRAFAEEVIFHIYQYRCFHEKSGEEIDFRKYVFDKNYRLETHRKRLGELDANLAEEKRIQGKEFYHSGDSENAVACYREAAELGNSTAMYEYALFLCDGEGCEKNPLLGSFWYWEAAHCGDSKAMYNLGVNYREGVGVKKDMVQMMYWYAKSAENLCKAAIYSLGCSLADEEVLSGDNVIEIGRIMMRAAADIGIKVMAQRFVENNTAVIIKILEEDKAVYNI